MKIFISSDIEGTTGIVDWNETILGNPEFAYFSNQMTKEVKAVCDGANEAGAAEIVIKDAHDSARNIIPSELPENTKLIRNWELGPLVMMSGLDQSFDAVVMTGYHSPASTNYNPLAHTLDTSIDKIIINGEIASELLINLYTASYFNVPVVCVTGDKGICDIAKKINSNITTIPVIEGMGGASMSINPNLAIRKIKEEVKNVLTSDYRKCLVTLPKNFDIKIRYKSFKQAYKASFYPNVELIDNQTISYKCDDYFEVLRLLLFVC